MKPFLRQRMTQANARIAAIPRKSSAEWEATRSGERASSKPIPKGSRVYQHRAPASSWASARLLGRACFGWRTHEHDAGDKDPEKREWDEDEQVAARERPEAVARPVR